MKRKLIIGLQAIAVTVVAVVGTAFAADAGSASDPVASKAMLMTK